MNRNNRTLNNKLMIKKKKHRDTHSLLNNPVMNDDDDDNIQPFYAFNENFHFFYIKERKREQFLAA
jgi:hypothetical protein